MWDHPQVANRDCDHCQQYQYDESTGKPVTWAATGQPLPRYPVTPPPCRTDKGCPKGTPEQPLSLSPMNRRAYQHYQRCKATGNFPEDSQVEQNAGIIGEFYFNRRELRECQTSDFLKSLALRSSPS